MKVLPFRAGDLLFNFLCHRVQNYKNILKEKDLRGGGAQREEGREISYKGAGEGFVWFCMSLLLAVLTWAGTDFFVATSTSLLYCTSTPLIPCREKQPFIWWS